MINLDKIYKIIYDNKEINKNNCRIQDIDGQSNFLIINTTNIINFTRIGNYNFKIYEKNIEEPLIYTLEIYEERNNINDVILNHHFYKLDYDNRHFLVLSGSDTYNSLKFVAISIEVCTNSYFFSNDNLNYYDFSAPIGKSYILHNIYNLKKDFDEC